MAPHTQSGIDQLAIRADLVDALYATPAAIATGSITVTLLMAAAGVFVGDATYLALAFAMGLIGLARGASHAWHTRRRARWAQRPAGADDAVLRAGLDASERVAMAGAWATALTVSIFGAYAVTVHAGQPVMVLALVQTVGYVAGISSRNTSSPLIPRVQVLLASAPLCAALLASGDPIYALMGLSTALIALLTFSSAQTIYNAVLARHHTMQELRHLATVDHLTGLLNRRGFLDALERMIEAGQAFVLLSVDIDNFKSVNDTLGHDRGDSLIRALASEINDVLRPGDVTARIGGDELMIAIPGSVEDAQELADAILRRMRHHRDLDGLRMAATVSIGLAAAEAGLDLEEALKRVDIALYGAKAEGRNRCVSYTAALRAAHDDELSFGREMRDGMRRGEFWLAYQPVYSQRAGTVTHVEALLRWAHPTRGAVSPAVFIPIAERSGVIHALGAWTLEAAVAAAVELPAQIGITVNISARQFDPDHDLVSIVAAVLRKSGLAPHRLTLEITETLFIADEALVAARLKLLRDMGVKIALDDFGTGYSSLSLLGWLPIDTLKIDKTFTKEIAISKRAHFLMGAVTKLAHDLGLMIIVEGVETDAQLDAMNSFTLHGIQGYLLSKPLSWQDLPAAINRRLDIRPKTEAGPLLPERMALERDASRVA